MTRQTRTPLIAALAAALALPAFAVIAHGPDQHGKHGQHAGHVANVDAAALKAAIASNVRDPKNSVRDRYRNPEATLTFFQVAPNETVIEITPGGGGWYSEILAPYLRKDGRYIAAMADPATLPEGRGRDYQQRSLDALKTRLAAHPAQFDRAQFALFSPSAPVFGEPGKADTVLTFRNVHNWLRPGTAQQYFNGFFAALKPGGTLGVVEHRAAPGTTPEQMQTTGYVTEALVIEMATKAGFVLEERSEINANPKDTKDHPKGVWTLPPTNDHDPEDAPMFQAIGESDRMTLRFRKPL